VNWAVNGPIVHPPDDTSENVEQSSGGMILAGENLRTQRKTCPSATLPTTNLTWTALGANLDLRSEKPATSLS
jgi:hypothetical protein